MMTVTTIRRYPVKSMVGERLQPTELAVKGLVGDRVVQVYDRRDRVVTARTCPRLLRHHATLGIDGEPLVDELPVLNQTTSDEVLKPAQRHGHLWVALANDVPVGFAHIEVIEPPVAHLQEIDVHPQHGRRGLGTKLVRAICA